MAEQMIGTGTTGGTEYVVRSAAARMPSSCWGTYRRVAVLEVVRGYQPPRIDARCAGVVEITATWERRHVGGTSRCAYARALAEAEVMAARLNAELVAA